MASELDDLRSFMEQRFTAADPSLDTSAGSVFDVEVITPLINRLAPDPFDSPLEDFARGRLAAEFPDLVLQTGEPIDDLIVKPMRIMLEPYRRQIAAVVRNQSVEDPTVLNDREADALAANYFVTRKLGGFSVGVARLYFNAPRFVLVVPTNTVSTSAGLNFFPVENQAISSDDMLFNTSGSLFYFDVVVRAENQGSDYNIDRDTLVTVEGLPEAVKVQNPAGFGEGSPREDTETFLSRVETSLTEKSLVTLRGINARILELFDNVRAVSVIGFGDVEMERDVITGSPLSTYGYGTLTASAGLSAILLPAVGDVTDGIASHDTFSGVGVAPGDTFSQIDLASGSFIDYTVVEVISFEEVRVAPTPPNLVTPTPFFLRSRDKGQILLSDIPGGILQPVTTEGELVIAPNQVHIGGALDVFVRAGEPTEQATDLTGIQDGSPLHFGIELRTFGADLAQFIQVTPAITAAATTRAADGAPFVGPGDASATIAVKAHDAPSNTIPWHPTDDDVGRYLEILGPDYGLLEIEEILGEEVIGGTRTVLVKVKTFDENSQASITVSDRSSAFDLSLRIVDKIPQAPLVRDHAIPQADFNGSSNGIGSAIGDSVVIENGTDAGIYTIRRILTQMGEDDTLVLDRNLAASGSSFRYRLTDELQVDLVNPRVVKMPLGGVFVADDLQTVAQDATVSVGGTSNFLLAGVEAGDTLEILEGANAGTYAIDSVTGTTLEVNPPPPSTGFALTFSVYRAFTGVERPMVRVKSVELLDSSSQPTGITGPYGDVIDARVRGRLSNRANGLDVESFSGEVVSTTLFRDAGVDFMAQGILPGYRMEILEGDNAGEYEIAEVAPPSGAGSPNELTIVPNTGGLGGKDLVTPITGLRYRIGEASSGVCRLYFLEPTSVEIDTGLAGARIEFADEGQQKFYRFSQVQGRTLLPAPGSGDDDPRDLRVVRSYDAGASDWRSILERTDTAESDFYDLEYQVDDIIEIHEQIPFESSAGTTFGVLGIFGNVAGLRTVSGQNRVTVPSNSHIDFTQMGPAGDLAGQLLYVNGGPDEGRYTIDRVVDAKTLELSAVMTASTKGIIGQELATLYDGTVIDPGDGFAWLQDVTDAGQLGNVGDFVTIFESGSKDVDGVYEIAEVNVGSQRVKLTGFDTALLPVVAGLLTWTISSAASGTVEQPFSIYGAVAKELSVTDVATKDQASIPPTTALPGIGNVLAGLATLEDSSNPFGSVVRGDRLEILDGPNRGVYPIFSATAAVITIYNPAPANLFNAIEVGAQYRVWAGVHGPRRMITVQGFEGSDARVALGDSMPYRLRRPAVHRVSSTEMEDFTEDGLYYADVEIESMGPGDDRNLADNTRLVVLSGLRADGYTYTVENNVLSFSTFEEVSLNFDRRFLPVGNSDIPENRTELNGRNIRITYESSTTAGLIDDLLRSDAERPVNANPVARHFLPSFVFLTLTYEGGSTASVVGPEIEEYINTLGPLAVLEVSDIEAFLSRRGSTSIRHPITLVSVTHDIDRTLVVERSQDQIGGLVVPFNGTARISSFFGKIGEGITLVRQ